jgi:hypothetical protein
VSRAPTWMVVAAPERGAPQRRDHLCMARVPGRSRSVGWSARRNPGIPRPARRRQRNGRRRGDPGSRREPQGGVVVLVQGARRRPAVRSQGCRAAAVAGRDEAWISCRGVMLTGADFDESPKAYRRLPDVLPAHASAVKILYTLRPVIVVVAGAGEKGSKRAAAK